VANIKSAKKRARQSVEHNLHNTTLRSRVYTFLKKARKAIASGSKSDAELAVRQAMSQIDRMVPKGIFRKNKAGRLKSRLNASLKKLAKAS
jgi:small subunit ribosomal protein S20